MPAFSGQSAHRKWRPRMGPANCLREDFLCSHPQTPCVFADALTGPGASGITWPGKCLCWAYAVCWTAMPILSVKHVTPYRYRQPVALGEHRMMLRPRDDDDQKV